MQIYFYPLSANSYDQIPQTCISQKESVEKEFSILYDNDKLYVDHVFCLRWICKFSIIYFLSLYCTNIIFNNCDVNVLSLLANVFFLSSSTLLTLAPFDHPPAFHLTSLSLCFTFLLSLLIHPSIQHLLQFFPVPTLPHVYLFPSGPPPPCPPTSAGLRLSLLTSGCHVPSPPFSVPQRPYIFITHSRAHTDTQTACPRWPNLTHRWGEKHINLTSDCRLSLRSCIICQLSVL